MYHVDVIQDGLPSDYQSQRENRVLNPTKDQEGIKEALTNPSDSLKTLMRKKGKVYK